MEAKLPRVKQSRSWLGDSQEMRMGMRVAGCDPPRLGPPTVSPSGREQQDTGLPKRDFKRSRSSWLIRMQVSDSTSLKIWERG